jgi:hypothetical protein
VLRELTALPLAVIAEVEGVEGNSGLGLKSNDYKNSKIMGNNETELFPRTTEGKMYEDKGVTRQ